MPRANPAGFADPMPRVLATFDDGARKELFDFYPDEITFDEGEFVGLTAPRSQSFGSSTTITRTKLPASRVADRRSTKVSVGPPERLLRLGLGALAHRGEQVATEPGIEPRHEFFHWHPPQVRRVLKNLTDDLALELRVLRELALGYED